MIYMETKEVILELQTQNGLSQDALAEKSLSRGKRYPGGKPEFYLDKDTTQFPR